MSTYDAYECRVCEGRGTRPNESRNLVNRAARVQCFCDGRGTVLVLSGFNPPWYAGARCRKSRRKGMKRRPKAPTNG